MLLIHDRLPAHRNMAKIKILGWPFYGDVIVLYNVTLADLDFFGWDTVYQPLKRNQGQDTKDKMYQHLLLLRAVHFDSQERYVVVAAVEDDSDPLASKVEIDKALRQTCMERQKMKIRWPSNGGLDY